MKYLLLLILILPTSVLGQRNILNAKSPVDIGKKTPDELYIGQDEGPLAYAYVNERDVLFSMTVWESIDLDERVNFPLYFPADTTVVRIERRPLIHYLISNVIDAEKPLSIYTTSTLMIKKPIDKLKKDLIYREIKEDIEGIGLERIKDEGNTEMGFLKKYEIDLGEYNDYDETDIEKTAAEEGQMKTEMIRLIFENNLLEEDEYYLQEFNYADVLGYNIKGVWYFDKRQAELKYRPIAICPVIETPKSKYERGINNEKPPKTVELFWMFYPDTREVLFEAEAFNEANTSKPVNFDHLINSRRFSAFIYKEDNVFQDRSLKEYIPENALMQLLESERIKEKVRNKEQDMWSY